MLIPCRSLIRAPAGVLRRWHGTAAALDPVGELVDQRMMAVILKIDHVIDSAPGEVDKLEVELSKQIKAAMGRLQGGAEDVKVWWTRTIREHVERLQLKHHELQEKVVALAQRMVEAVPDSFGVEPPPAAGVTVFGPYSARDAYEGVLHRWDEDLRGQIIATIEDAQRGDISRNEAKIRLVSDIPSLTTPMAKVLIRTGIGSAQGQATEQRLQEIGQSIGGILKVWRATIGGPAKHRPWHFEAHMQAVALDQDFVLNNPRLGTVYLKHPCDPAADPSDGRSCMCWEGADVSGAHVGSEVLA